MKILKTGKVEQRKFVCEKCGCEFVANEVDFNSGDSAVKIKCPCCWQGQRWDCGEPYEEPTPMPDVEVKGKLMAIMDEWNRSHFGGVDACADFCMKKGMTFREG